MQKLYFCPSGEFRNRIPEYILHANIFSNILHGVSQYLLKDNVYTLLYGFAVNPYYGMDVVKSLIINGALFMTIFLPLKHYRAPILSLHGLFSYHLLTNMSHEKSQYTLLNSDFDRQVVQYDHMYVQQEPLLLFRRTDKNCYINIIEHAPARTITCTCTFLYYHKITVHASLVTTSHFFYLLNINDELKITCKKYSRETTHRSHSVSNIKLSDACDCVIQSVEIQLIGSHSNCSSNGNFIIYHTFNFVTEWLHNKIVIPYYRENEHILRLPSSASIPYFSVIKTNLSCVFSANNVTPISLKQLDTIIGDLKQNRIYLSNTDKIGQDNAFFNESIMDNFESMNKLLNIDSWFDESSMIFIFVSCIIALLTFILLIFLCFKHEKLRKLISLYMASPQVVNATAVDTSCNTGNIFQYILSNIWILILTYAIIKMIIRGCQSFRRYQTTTHFLCEHGHNKGPSMAIALELSTMSEITHVHIAHLNIPITRLSVHETDHNAYYLVSGNWFYDFLKISQPIILLHRNGVIPICTPVKFKVRFFQSFKLKRILHTDYPARVVRFQNGYMYAIHPGL